MFNFEVINTNGFDRIKQISIDENLIYQYSFMGNLPSCQEEYQNGNGEGCHFLPLTETDRKKYDEDCGAGTINAIILNDSIFYPSLNWGTIVQLECRGKKRPVLDLAWYKNNASGNDEN